MTTAAEVIRQAVNAWRISNDPADPYGEGMEERIVRELEAAGLLASADPCVRATNYVVTAAPDWDHPDAHLWDIEVSYRGNDKWGVYNRTRCLGADGEWSWESIPAERRDEWLAEHRFDLSTALRLAQEQAAIVVTGGLTVGQARERWEAEA